MRRAASGVLSVLSAVGTVLFAYAYYDRYWLWRGCFNDLGRCFDPGSEQVYLEQAGLIWGIFATGCLLLCGFFAWRASRNNKGASATSDE
jgi:hypothetical protein